MIIYISRDHARIVPKVFRFVSLDQANKMVNIPETYCHMWRAGPHSPLLQGTKVEIDLCDPKVWRYTPLVLMPGRQRQIDLCDLKAW